MAARYGRSTVARGGVVCGKRYRMAKSNERAIETLRRMIPLLHYVYGESREAMLAYEYLEAGLLWLEEGIRRGTIILPPDLPSSEGRNG